jgi:hypothetical protein
MIRRFTVSLDPKPIMELVEFELISALTPLFKGMMVLVEGKRTPAISVFRTILQDHITNITDALIYDALTEGEDTTEDYISRDLHRDFYNNGLIVSRGLWKSLVYRLFDREMDTPLSQMKHKTNLWFFSGVKQEEFDKADTVLRDFCHHGIVLRYGVELVNY